MANVTTADVKRLRELTGAGMMDCKRALEESDGAFERAVEYLRIKGAKDAGKRAERTTAEGLVAASGGSLIELNCETDFVAKNSDFQELAARIASTAQDLDGPVDVPALMSAPLGDSTVESEIGALSARIGEKLVLKRAARLDGDTAVYLHKRSADLPPSIGVVVAFTGTGDEAAEAARGAAMQVSALGARYPSREVIPAEVIDSERRIAEATAREEGKPEPALPKIVEGRLNGFYKDAVLTEQPSVRDSKQTVGKVLAAAGVTVTDFVRFEVGTA